MKTKDELLKLAIRILGEHDGDKQRACDHLIVEAENDPEIMAGLAKHGFEILGAMAESETATKH